MIKKFVFRLSIVLIFLMAGCNNDDSISRNCNFLLDVGVNATINLDLPQFSSLQFTSNSAFVPNQGNAGIIIINVGSGNFRAWDAADPNHSFSACSLLEIEGVEVKCGCPDENRYSLYTGQSLGEPLTCGLLEYRVNAAGSNNLIISN